MYLRKPIKISSKEFFEIFKFLEKYIKEYENEESNEKINE